MGLVPFSAVKRIDADTMGFYSNDMTKLLQIDKVTANRISVKGGLGVTGDDLFITSNTIDAKPAVNMYGNGVLELSSDSRVNIIGTRVDAFAAEYRFNSANPFISTVTNSDLGLTPNGTGLVKFGTYTVLGAEVSDGFITIKDAGGTERKLLVVA